MISIDDFIEGFSVTLKTQANPWEITGDLPHLINQTLAMLDENFTIQDGIAIHKSAVVEKGAIIKSPAIIGPNSFIAAHAYLRGGVYTLSNVSIGAGCEIKSSIIFNNSSIAHFNFIGDSIIGSNVNFEAGSITANHHNDRDDKTITVVYNNTLHKITATKFGALVGDGCKIGANAVLSPGTVLPKETIVKRLELIDQAGSQVSY